MSALYWTQTIRQIEQQALAQARPLELMERAARELADRCASVLRNLPPGIPSFALVGPGNNGGDALLAAMQLRARGFEARAVLLDERAPSQGDAARARGLAAQADLPGQADLPARLGAERALFIDGLFGIGLSRPISGRARMWIDALNSAGACVVAADIPSGLSADTGAVVGGRQGAALKARVTVSFIGDKPGLHTGAAPDYVGELHIADLAVPAARRDGTLISAEELLPLVRPLARSPTSHKGRQGQVGVVGGALGMQGAALLAALGAHRAGAGKVFVMAPDHCAKLPSTAPQIMTRDAGDALADASSLVIGCGLGQSPSAYRLMYRALTETACPLTIDADGLNLLARHPELSVALASRRAASVLTPHPLEAARLLETDIATIEANRLRAARSLARRYQALIVLKGAGSLIAHPSGEWAIVGAGSPALATAGTGDVLAGVMAGLTAQRLGLAEAAIIGAWIHGRAGERWAEDQKGTNGLSAAELPDAIRSELNTLIRASIARPTLHGVIP